jgi:hypothetical protein
LLTAFVLTLLFMPADSIFAADSKTVSATAAAGYTMDLSGYANKWAYQDDSKCYALTGVV